MRIGSVCEALRKRCGTPVAVQWAPDGKSFKQTVNGRLMRVDAATGQAVPYFNSDRLVSELTRIGMKPDEVMSMRNDAHATNFAENIQFFLNSSNPTNFERTWKNASYVYRELGSIDAPVAFDQVMDFSVIQKLGAEPTYGSSKDEYAVSMPAKTVQQIVTQVA